MNAVTGSHVTATAAGYYSCVRCLQLLENKPVRCPCCGTIGSFTVADPAYVEAYQRLQSRQSASPGRFGRRPQDGEDEDEEPTPVLFSAAGEDEDETETLEAAEEEEEPEAEAENEPNAYEEKPLPPPMKVEVKRLFSIQNKDVNRIPTRDGAFDNVLSGLPEHRCLMFSGQPGTGKSTLLRQVSAGVAEGHVKVMYVSGEESEVKIKQEFRRLGLFKKFPHSKTSDLLFASAIDPEGIVQAAHEAEVDVLVVDSLGKMKSRRARGAAGKDSQVVHAAVVFQSAAHAINAYEGCKKMTVLLVVHATKGGDMSGANAAKHETDGAFMLETIDPVTREPVDDPNIKTGHVRLRVHGKYREGSDTIYGYYRMTEHGLVDYDPEDDPGDAAFEKDLKPGLVDHDEAEAIADELLGKPSKSKTKKTPRRKKVA